MKLSMRPLLAALIVGASGLSFVHSAQAGCGFSPSAIKPPMLKPNAWHPSTQSVPTLQSAYYRAGADGRFVPTSDHDGIGGWPGDAAIVGMWRFQLTGMTGVPPGTVVDDGYAQWHSDGTEIQDSGVHAPNTSNFCLGVWQQVGPLSYRLNHLPLAWDPTANNGTGSPANAIQLTETVHLTDWNHMTGTFTLKVYVWTSTSSLNVLPTTPVATITGTVAATRVAIDSTVPGSTM